VKCFGHFGHLTLQKLHDGSDGWVTEDDNGVAITMAVSTAVTMTCESRAAQLDFRALSPPPFTSSQNDIINV
jgi:hypothetical protein